MGGKIIVLRAETFIHPGVGQTTGAIDLPVARERITDYPFIPGSGVKGAFRVWAREQAGLGKKEKTLFGNAAGDVDANEASEGESTGKDNEAAGGEGAGLILFSDARLLLLPVRCTSAAWKWATCPDLLKRLERDCSRAGMKDISLSASVEKGKYLGTGENGASLGLEEREFSHAGAVADDIIQTLADVSGIDDEDLRQRLVILNDDDFVWFARHALPIMARNALDENKKVKRGALWYEEALPPDTVMHVVLGERQTGALQQLTSRIDNAPYIQMGGNETVGQGWFRMQMAQGRVRDGQEEKGQKKQE